MLKQEVNLSGLSLPQSQFEDAVLRMRRARSSYERKVVDFELWDAIQDLLSTENYKPVLDDLRSSVKSPEVTKAFKNSDVMMEALLHYDGPEKHSFIWNENFRLASNLLGEWIGKPSLTPIQYNTAEELLVHLPNKEASAGAIHSGSKADNVDLIFASYKELVQRIEGGERPWVPALSFHRAQISGYMNDHGRFDPSGLKQKDRLVWGLSADHVAVESQFAIPFVNHMSENVGFYAGGKTPDQLRRRINVSFGRPRFWYSLDFSKFDQTVPSWLIRHAFSFVRMCYKNEYQAQLQWIEDEFINTKIISYDGRVYSKDRGIPSGSNFTQAIGSICNALVIMTYLFSRMRGMSDRDRRRYVDGHMCTDRRNTDMLVMGDDNLFFWDVKLDLVDLSQYVSANFGMKIHPEKTDMGRNRIKFPVFLKREWRGVWEYRDLAELLINVIHPERIRTYEGFTGYHLLYGLLRTYGAAFPIWSEGKLVHKMRENGGLSQLRKLKGRNMPGVFRQFGDKAGELFYSQAKTFLNQEKFR